MIQYGGPAVDLMSVRNGSSISRAIRRRRGRVSWGVTGLMREVVDMLCGIKSLHW